MWENQDTALVQNTKNKAKHFDWSAMRTLDKSRHFIMS